MHFIHRWKSLLVQGRNSTLAYPEKDQIRKCAVCGRVERREAEGEWRVDPVEEWRVEAVEVAAKSISQGR